MSEHVRRALAALLTVTVLAACQSGQRPPAGASATPAVTPAANPAPGTAPDVGQVRTLLADSWVSDGRHGYFVDDAWSATRSPFSLYDTYWRLRLEQPGGTVLDRDAVARWLPGPLQGRQSTSPLPAMGQISYAARIASMMDIPANGAGPALEALRSGGRYRTTGTSAPNWGSTALAVEALTLSRLPVPDAVTATLRAALSEDGPPWTAATAVETLIPQLQAAAALSGAGLPPQLLARRVQQALHALGDQPDVVWLGAQAQLREDAARLGIPTTAFPQRGCDQLLRPDGTVAVPGQAAPDPQLTFYARAVGCARTVVPPSPPRSRAGWPPADGIGRALPISLAGLRLARILGPPDPAMDDRLRSTLLDTWLPALSGPAPAGGIGRTLVASRLRILAAEVAPAERTRIDLAVAGERPDLRDDLQRLLSMVDAAQLADDTARRAAAAGVPASGQRSMFSAAAEELAARLGGDPARHANATATTTALRLDGGLYLVAAEPTGTPPADAGSLTATVLAAWITGTSVPVTWWAGRGLCRAGHCGENTTEAADRDSTSLRILALIHACAQPACGPGIPLLL
ncbi:hypothetical protein AB0K00_54350 [Dactylosporangium sp. NPDC049525]|uniref:hypothetical protein n=1 Tax=Dactylosporangium sp. NPDC049525 TaxID=3154730 RepID=UPI003448156D